MDCKTIQNPGSAKAGPRHLSVLAVISMILGFFFFIPLISGLFAIILGIIALYSIAMYKDELRGRGFAITGIVAGILQFIAAIVFLSAVIFAMFIGTIRSYPPKTARIESSPRRDYNQMVGVNEFYTYNEKGVSLQTTGKPRQALEAYQSALTVAKKEMGIAYYGIGFIHMELRDYDKALDEFDKAIEYNPNLYDAYQNKAVTYRLIGRYQDSVNACKKTVKLFPDFARAYCSMGWAYEYLGKYKEAIDAHLEAIRLAPGWQFPRQRIEYCLYMLKDKQLRFDIEQKIKQIEKDAVDSAPLEEVQY